MEKKEKNLGAIILAAGKGKRMNSKKVNKVALPLGGKPMILHTAELLKKINVSPIVIVIGFAKDSVKGLFNGDVLFAEQKKRLGTAHAVSVAFKELPKNVSDVLILQGDDSAFYEHDIIGKLLKAHEQNGSSLTFLTIEVDNPTGLGRVLRDKTGKLIGIIEEKDATRVQKKITEINPACYVIDTQFLRKYLKQVKKSPVTGEYYLTSLIDIGIRNNENIQTVKGGRLHWRGVNTKEELLEAEKLLTQIK